MPGATTLTMIRVLDHQIVQSSLTSTRSNRALAFHGWRQPGLILCLSLSLSLSLLLIFLVQTPPARRPSRDARTIQLSWEISQKLGEERYLSLEFTSPLRSGSNPPNAVAKKCTANKSKRLHDHRALDQRMSRLAIRSRNPQ